MKRLTVTILALLTVSVVYASDLPAGATDLIYTPKNNFKLVTVPKDKVFRRRSPAYSLYMKWMLEADYSKEILDFPSMKAFKKIVNETPEFNSEVQH